jgi:hypothetical protein
MKRTMFLLASLIAVMTAKAQEQIESIIIAEHDSAYYAQQAQLWQQEVKKRPQDGNAWRNYYQAAFYETFYTRDGYAHTAQIVDEMEKAIPNDYTYYVCRYKQGGGMQEHFDYAEEALKRLPGKMGFFDYDMMTSYLMMRFDEVRLSELAKRYYESGLYSPGVLQYNYNELQGMDEGGIYFGNGDACLIPKILLQYGKGVHQDKLVVCLPFLAIPDYRNKLLTRLGIDPTLYQYEQPQSEDDYDRQERELVDLIISHTHRPVYFSTFNSEKVNAPWQKNLYNEGLTLRYSPTKYDNMAVMRRNVEERYQLEYLLEQFCPDHWIVAERLLTNYTQRLKDLLFYYKKHDTNRYKWLMRRLMSGIDHARMDEEQKEHFRKMLAEK